MKIAVWSVKGGVGKSTIAAMVSALRGCDYKERDDYQLPYKNKDSVVAPGECEIHAYGGYLRDTLAKEIKSYPRVVIPTGPGPANTRALLSSVDFVFASGFSGSRLVIVLNRVAPDEEKAELERMKEVIRRAIKEGKVKFNPKTKIKVVTMRESKTVRRLEAMRYNPAKIEKYKKRMWWSAGVRQAFKSFEEVCDAILEE